MSNLLYVLIRPPEEGSNGRPAGNREPENGVIARGCSPRVITPSEGERLPKGRLWQLDSVSEWSNWLRPRSRRAAILLRTCSSFASLKERSDVVSSLPSYWQLRRASLCLERLWNSSAKVELVFDKNELFIRDLTAENLRLTWNFKASDVMNN